jgi:hypothetical protein
VRQPERRLVPRPTRIRPDFTLDEPDAAEHRRRFLQDRAAEARALEAAEDKRRERKAARAEAEEPEEAEEGAAAEEEGEV